jgi:hypothetical protein
MKPFVMSRPWIRCLVLLALASIHYLASADRLPISKGSENFSAEALLSGVSATHLDCSSLTFAVWVRLDSGETECIRYWTSGLADSPINKRALIYIPGDQIVGDQPAPGYVNLSPEKLQSIVNAMASKVGVPLILVARSGTFGSSGDHKQRRRSLEPRLVSKALDELKVRYGIQELSMVGLSGGGHTVASLLGWRSDITCAVPTSSVSSPRLRWEDMGRVTDWTGYADSYEPMLHLRREVINPKLRVFVLGDPRDSNVKWSTQIPIAARMKELGIPVETLTGEGSDAQRHALGESGRLIGALCLLNRPTSEILEIAARGLKG